MKKILFYGVFIYGILISQLIASAENFSDKKPITETLRDPEVRRIEPLNFYSSQVDPILSTPKFESEITLKANLLYETQNNLISNPSVEDSTLSNIPQRWFKGGYGVNTRTFTYPVSGVGGGKAIKVDIQSYTSGDAKWYFEDIPVTAGKKYNFSDYYISNLPSTIDVRYKMNDGTYKYFDISHVGANTGPDFKKTTVEFVVPQNAVSASIFHLIQGVGSLITDEHSLIDLSAPPYDVTNLIPNSNFEEISNGLPLMWKKGGWGTNNRFFSYPVISHDGSKATKVEITNYSSGDAKWYFNFINIPSGIYTYSEDFLSNTESEITLQYQNTNGNYFYTDIARLPKSAGSAFGRVTADVFIPAGAKNITIFHLIQGVGALTLDNTSLKLKQKPSGIFETGAVTFRFDDGWASQYENAVPKLNSAGFNGTFYITSRQLYEYGFTDFMSKNQVKEINNQGHEIGAHTRSHAHLTQLGTQQQQDEILGSKEDILALGVESVNSFSYPFGEYTADIIQIVKNAGFNSAVSVVDGYASPLSDLYQLERQNVVITTTVDQIKKMVDEAIVEKKWLILEIHEVRDSGGHYRITKDNFNQIVDYIKQKNIPVVTISEGVGSF